MTVGDETASHVSVNTICLCPLVSYIRCMECGTVVKCSILWVVVGQC